MPRHSQNIEEVLKSAVADAMKRIASAVQHQVAALAAEELEKSLAVNGAARRSPWPARRARAPRKEIDKWVADKRARRVPKFVIEATGLDTKKKIVAKFGANAVFERGEPLPKPAKAA